jgi:hypothetical protein
VVLHQVRSAAVPPNVGCDNLLDLGDFGVLLDQHTQRVRVARAVSSASR